MQKLPQRLVNVRVADRDALEGAQGVWQAVEQEAAALEGRGRVLIRPGGTEPVVRVMVEAPDERECEDASARLVAAVERELRLALNPRLEVAVLHQGASGMLRGATLRPMCGIVGDVGDRPCRDLLLYGLQMLEYRGYDSAGLSLLVDGQIVLVRAVGHLSELEGGGRLAAANGDGIRRVRVDHRDRAHAVGDPRGA